ncbi:MAG TPA: nicotinate-nucleotide adenylyltransferase [Chloroflexota bacterium]|jgi:nicotinate-nucleotide adenylyltransferase
MSGAIGIFGGTFDPIHVGHLFIAQEAAATMLLDRVLFVPTADPVHRLVPPVASQADRGEMVRLAIADNQSFEFSSVELDRPGPTFTIDTLRVLAQLHPKQTLYFIVGTDSLAELPQWREPAQILELARIVAMARPGRDKVDLEALEAILPGARRRVCVVQSPGLDVSARDIRARIAEGKPVRYLVPEPVREYIQKRGLYGGTHAD